MKGIYGCNILIISINTWFRVYCVLNLSFAFSEFNLGFANSMYKSQNSFQINVYSFSAAIPNSYFSIFAVTSLTIWFFLEIIHLSVSWSVSKSTSFSTSKSSRFIRINLAALLILFAKFLFASTLLSCHLVSLPALFPVTREKRSTSAPYLSITSSGSIPFPRDLLIFLPCESLTKPWIYTWWKGGLPICSIPENTILATQKKIISKPVTKTSFG